MGSGAADIGEIVPEVRGKIPGLNPSPPLEPTRSQFRLFDSITTFLKSISGSYPLVLVLEDLHWADRTSLLYLNHLVRDLREGTLLVVGTYRDVEVSRQHPLTETLGSLSRESEFQRISLSGLGEEYAGEFIRAAAGVSPPSDLVATIHTQTEGNPFFMTEVVRLLGDRGEPSGEGESNTNTVQMPDGVRDAIDQRLNRLSAQCNETLTVASIIG